MRLGRWLTMNLAEKPQQAKNQENNNAMAKKRKLKQTVNRLCSDLFAEAVAISLYGAHADDDSTKALLASILLLRDDFVRRISHPEPGMEQKKYFQNLIKEFTSQANDIIDQINSLA